MNLDAPRYLNSLQRGGAASDTILADASTRPLAECDRFSKLGGHFGRNEGAGAAVDNALERTLALDSDGHDDPVVDELKGNDCDGLGIGGATANYRQEKDQPRDDPHGS